MKQREELNSNTVPDDPWPKPDFDGKITRGVLEDLETGLMLISGVGDQAWHPTLEAILGPPETCESLWRKMVELRVNGRKFRGFLNPEDFEKEKLMRLRFTPTDGQIQ
jgi:hypothetical protein